MSGQAFTCSECNGQVEIKGTQFICNKCGRSKNINLKETNNNITVDLNDKTKDFDQILYS